MKTTLIILAVVLIGVGIVTATSPSGTLGSVTGGSQADACTITSVTPVAVGHQLATTVVAAKADRAYVQLQLPISGAGVATNTVAVSFGSTATISSGLTLATSTPTIEFGLNTALPYTGAVSAITSTGSTTLSMVICEY